MGEADWPGLSVRSLSVAFGGIVALDRVNLDVAPGEAVGLVGPNGAGKSTIVNCVGGQLEPRSGSISLDGVLIDHLAPYRRARLGVGRTFQRVALFPQMSVEDHLLVSLRATKPRLTMVADRGRPRDDERQVLESVLAELHLSDHRDALVATLPLALCRLVEVGRALVGRPKVLLADEPSSGLDPQEAAMLGHVLRSLAGQGIGLLLVEHDLSMVSSVCDRVIVLHLGRIIAQGPYGSVMSEPEVRRAYLGEVA
ncbi:MAG: ABC transporter ATP-binding protein [Acidimicrobiales bacterium]